MQISPLHLERFFFRELWFEWDEQFDATSDEGRAKVFDPLPIHVLNCDISLLVARKDARERVYDLQLESRTEEGDFPYRFRARIRGEFRVGEEVEDGKVNGLADANAPAVLYGVLREALASATGRGPFAPVCLPSVNFLDVAFTPPSEEDESPALPKPRGRRRKQQEITP